MPRNDREHSPPAVEVLPRPATLSLLVIATAIAIIHILTNGSYGFHRDELQFLSDALHLDWGFVSYPPLTPFLAHISYQIFGLSLEGLRLFTVLAQSMAILVTGLMTRELGGARLAQVAAALSVALSPIPLYYGTLFQYSSFDFLWWVLISYFTIRLLRTENPRWWLAIGAAVGLGLLTKYSIIFLIAGILTGVVLTPARRFLATAWFWCGITLALIIFLPNFIWLVKHDFISYRFLQSIHARDVATGRGENFLQRQFYVCVNPFAAPLWITGLIAYLLERRYRMLAWMYLIPLALFFFNEGRHYYMAAAYPMLLAMGASAAEHWIAALPKFSASTAKTRRRGSAKKIRRSLLPGRAVVAVFFICLVLWGARLCAMTLPIQSSGPLRDFALKQNGDLREEFGWNELVKTIADIRDSLPQSEQANVGVLVGNYGEQGAIELLGPPYHLPLPISVSNSAWLRGYPANPPTTLIVVGVPEGLMSKIFTECRVAGYNGNAEGVSNEESQKHHKIFVCGPPREPWPEFWKDYQQFE